MPKTGIFENLNYLNLYPNETHLQSTKHKEIESTIKAVNIDDHFPIIWE